MEDEIREQNGPIGAMAKISRELVNTPMFKKQLQLILNELDPENIPSLIHTLIWEDPDFFLQTIGTTSAFINLLIEVTCELMRNISQFQAPVLIETISSVVKRIDIKAVGESAGIAQVLLSEIVDIANSNPEVAETMSELGKGAAEGYKEVLSSHGKVPGESFNPATLLNLAIKLYKNLLQNMAEKETPVFMDSVSNTLKDLDIKAVGEGLGISQMLLTDTMSMSDSNPAVSEAVSELGNNIFAGYKEAFAARNTTPEDYFDRLTQVGLKLMSSMMASINKELQKPDSIIKKTIHETVQNMVNLLRENPAFMTEMIGIALSLWQNMMPGARRQQPPPQQPPQQPPPQQQPQ